MSKDNSNSQQKQRKSYDTTNMFYQNFYKAYDFLSEKGEKKVLHIEIAEKAKPFAKEATIRAYCNDIERIPEDRKSWYLRLITPVLSRMVEAKIKKEREKFEEKEAVLESLPALMEIELNS